MLHVPIDNRNFAKGWVSSILTLNVHILKYWASNFYSLQAQQARLQANHLLTKSSSDFRMTLKNGFGKCSLFAS